MNQPGLMRLLIAPAAMTAMMLTACLNEQVVNKPAEVEVTGKEADPRIEFLVKEADIKRELISVSYDPASGDTAYILEPPLTAQQKKMGMKGTGIGFKSSQLEKVMKAAQERKTKEAAAAPVTDKNGFLVKKAHTRWDNWYAAVDVKSLAQVNEIRVFIYKVGPPRLGPNWIAAVRNAISNWNAQAKGTAVRFVETQDETACDLTIKGSFGIGNDGMLTSTAFLSADEHLNPDDIGLWVNTGYEHSGFPHNQKTTVAMSLLALSTNVTFTGMEGYYWNNGASVHVPGTPATDGDGLIPGSSILTYGTSSVSTPVMTEGDLKTFRTIYPVFGTLAILNNNGLSMNGYLDYNVKSFEVATDTLVYLRYDGRMFRRIGRDGASVQIWPASGSSGNAAQFLYDKGYMVVRNSYGNLFTRTPTGNWIQQPMNYAVAPTDFRLDGARLVTGNQARTELSSYHLGGTTPVNPVPGWYSSNGTITDWQVHNGILLVVDGGNVWGMQDYQGWHFLHSASSGYAYNVQISDQLMTMYYNVNGLTTNSYAVRHGGLVNGFWQYRTDPINKADDIHLCRDKVAFLQWTSYLRIVDYAAGAVYEHYTMPTGTEFQQTKLSGPNCDFVTSRSIWGPAVWAKYGVDLENRYLIYSGATKKLAQGSVPDL